MIGIYMGGAHGGPRIPILLHVPGAPAAIATALDGYPTAQKGMAGEAIGIVALAVFASLLAEFAIRFQPHGYMVLAMPGILLVGFLSGERLIKGIFAGALGICPGAVGIAMYGIPEGLTQVHTVNTPAIRQKTERIIPSWSWN